MNHPTTKSTANATPDRASSRCQTWGASADRSEASTRQGTAVRLCGVGLRSHRAARRNDRSILPESQDRRVDPEEQLPQELGGDQERHAGWLPPVEEHADVPDQKEWPSDQSEPGHAPRDEAGAVHQVAEDQPVPKGDDEPRAEQERPILERGERDGEVARVRRVLAQADDPEHKDDPARNEDALNDSSSDVADREEFVLSPHDRIENNSRSDIGDDEQQLQEGTQVDLAVLPATGDVPGWIVEDRLEESQCANRRDERDQEEHSEDPRIPLILSHPTLLCCLPRR